MNLHPLHPVSEKTELSFMIKKLTTTHFVMWDHADVVCNISFFQTIKRQKKYKGHVKQNSQGIINNLES